MDVGEEGASLLLEWCSWYRTYVGWSKHRHLDAPLTPQQCWCLAEEL
jgi:hypothetical protein